MERFTIFRIFVLSTSIIGLILYMVSILVSHWISISSSSFRGHRGLFFLCVEQLTTDETCSYVSASNTIGNYKVSQVFMCVGLICYFMFVVLAALTFFWTRRVKAERGIKIGAAILALLAVVCLIIVVITVKNNLQDDSETLDYGWYLAVVSLALATLASPCYLIDASQTVKRKFRMKEQLTNVAPRPTAITEYQRRSMIDKFNKQMSKLPVKLIVKHKSPDHLYDDSADLHPPPRPITPIGSEDCPLDKMDFASHNIPMIIPESFTYCNRSLYDDNDFVHPPPQLISADVSVKNLFRKKLAPPTGFDSDTSSIRSGYSLEGGQLDDCDLEIYMITNGQSVKNLSTEDRPQSREAFEKKRRKKKHKETKKHIDGKLVTKIEHEGLPSIKVIGPDRDISDYKNDYNSDGQKDNDIKSSSPFWTGNHKKGHQRIGEYPKSDEEVYFDHYGVPTPYISDRHANEEKTLEGVQDNEHKSSKPKSSKQKTKKRKKSHDKRKEKDVINDQKDDVNDDSKTSRSAIDDGVEAKGTDTPHKKHKRDKSKSRKKKSKKSGNSGEYDDKLNEPKNEIENEHSQNDPDKTYFSEPHRNAMSDDEYTKDNVFMSHNQNQEDNDMCTNADDKASTEKARETENNSERINAEINTIGVENADNSAYTLNDEEGKGQSHKTVEENSPKRKHNSRKKKRKKNSDEVTDGRAVENDRKSVKKKYKRKPYVGSDAEYDNIVTHESRGDNEHLHLRIEDKTSDANMEKQEISYDEVETLDEILKIPVKNA